MKKKCFKCDVTKPLSDFYKHAQMADGHLNKCKSCNKADVQSNYRANKPHYQEYYRQRNLTPERKDAKKRYLDKQKQKYPQKYTARNMVNAAVRDGKIIKPDCCSECKKKCSPHSHHDDYLKPLEVRWLCVQCHARHHDGFKALN